MQRLLLLAAVAIVAPSSEPMPSKSSVRVETCRFDTARLGSRQRGVPLASVPSQANTCTAVGTATATLASEKNASARCGMPTVNMWWTQMPKLMKARPMIATTMAR